MDAFEKQTPTIMSYFLVKKKQNQEVIKKQLSKVVVHCLHLKNFFFPLVVKPPLLKNTVRHEFTKRN